VNGDPAFAEAATVEVGAVTKWFGQKVAVSKLSCSFGPGVTGLLGPNGAGKTTLLRMLTGLLEPSEGTVTVLGEPPRLRPAVYASIGLVPEENAVYPRMTARQFVRYAAVLSKIDDPDAVTQRALEEVQLVGDADRRLSGFSKGMRQRAKVAAALVHEPEVLVLDEPLNGTDPIQRARLIELFTALGERGRTVIVSSHILEEVERVSERVLAIVDGRLAAAGNVAAIRGAMDDIPYRVRVGTDQPRNLAAALLQEALVHGVSVDGLTLEVETNDLLGLGARIAPLAQEAGAALTLFKPEDESLESVFRYLVRRR
jgi:ABC-2 type transport system ATP-binding protein